MKVLSIGNSFSQDAQRYLHQIAQADGFDLDVFNLYIGGCSLATHYRNMLSEKRAYLLEMNGKNTGFYVSLQEALLNRDWDVVTVQQVSDEAVCYETYQPYLSSLAECIRHCLPKAKIVVHQTWAYKPGSPRLCEQMGYDDHPQMFRDVQAAYQKAAEEIRADFVIPSGEVMQELLANGIETVHRDNSHASLGLGRYALGLTWYTALSERDVAGNTFSAFDEDVTEEQMEIAKKCVQKVCRNFIG